MLGCVLYEMCTTRRPFQGESLKLVLHNITNVQYEKLPSDFDPIFHRLIEVLLQKSASLRASIIEILEMKEVKDNIKEMQDRSGLSSIKYIKPIS